MKSHRVRQGDCLSSIAAKYGRYAQALWNHGDNQALKDLRKTPDVLAPGDIVKIPDLEKKSESVASDKKHQFVKKGKTYLHLKLVVEDLSLAGENYEISINGRSTTGSFGTDGKIDVNIPPNASSGYLVVLGRRFGFGLGDLDPGDTVTGIQARLNQLGYPAGAIDDDCGPKTHRSISVFQQANDMEVTGELDDATINKIKDEYGA